MSDTKEKPEEQVTGPDGEGEDGAASASPEQEAQPEAGASSEEADGDGAGEAAQSTEDLLAQVMQERDELKDKLARTAADLENFRKRSRRDLDETERRTREDTLRELLPIVDNLERAANAADNAQDVQSVAEGIQMVLKQFQEIANRLGLERIDASGERFDPNVHDAVQQQETDEVPPNTVVGEIVPGYMLGDRLLRAAMVVVARPTRSPSPQEGSGEPDPE